MSSHRFRQAASLGFVVLLGGLAPSVARDGSRLPSAAASAVKSLFPAAEIVGVGVEREAGVRYYEVAVREGMRTTEIEVTADGAIGEIETTVPLTDLPGPARDALLGATGGVEVRKVERHEVRGVPRDGTFVPVDPPSVFFEAAHRALGVPREILVAEDGTLLRETQDDDQAGDGDGEDDED